MKYNCKECGYLTSKKSNFVKHLNTKKHIENLEVISSQKLSNFTQKLSIKSSQIICDYCQNIVSHKKNLNRYYSICKEKIKHDAGLSKDKIIEDLKKEKEEAINQVKLLQNLIKYNRPSITNNNTINAFYVMQNFTEGKDYLELMNEANLTEEEYNEIKVGQKEHQKCY